MLAQLISRLDRRKSGGRLVIATTKEPEDAAIAQWAAEAAVPCLKGATNDLVKRFQQCAEKWPADVIVRVTADNPLTDPQLLDQLLEHMTRSGADYGYFPNAVIGTVADALTAKTLARLVGVASSPKDREHLNRYILDHPADFNIARLDPPQNSAYPQPRLTVDTAEDLAFMRTVYGRYNDPPVLNKILADFAAGGFNR